MRAVIANGMALHVRQDGAPNGSAMVLSNSLGTDLRLWDALVPLLPEGLRLIRYDMRRHGLSCEENPAAYAAILNPFLKEHAHV